jgi:non-ribosomal peptide synthetase component E (peptide arylation enzyme)
MTTSLHTDISGWATRLNALDVARYTGSGVWRNVTLAETARRQAGQDAQRIAVIEGGRSATFGTLLAQANQLAAAFQALRLRPGDVISFQFPNWIETMVINTAACIAGLGYTKAEQTLEAFDADGYFHTGDLGYYVDGDCLCVSGRKKDLIIRGGENISPKEIEDLLHTHPAIKETAVVAMPHPRLGEGVCAFVIPQPRQTVDVAALAAFLEKAGLARQKFPEHVEVVDDLPRTASGKVQKNLLRERIAAKLATK